MNGPAFKKTPEYDVIVVGDGIAGLGAAYSFIQRGKKTLILTPSTPVKGTSTPASAGILDPFLESASPAHPFFRLKKKAFLQLPREIRRIEKLSGIKTGYERTGMLFAALTQADEKKLKQRLTKHRPAGIPIYWIEKKAALRRWPNLSNQIRGVLYYPTLGRVFPERLQKALRTLVKNKGVHFRPISGKARLVTERGKTVGVKDQKNYYASLNVINALGSWADHAKLSSLRFPVIPIRGQVVIVKGRLPDLKTVVHSAGGTYIVPWENGHFLLGSTVEEAGFDARVQPAVLKKIHRSAAEMIPDLARCKPVRNWAGLRPRSKDHLPLLGKTSLKGYYMAAGYYRSGIVICVYAGRLLAESILSQTVAKEMRPFNPMRFNNAESNRAVR